MDRARRALARHESSRDPEYEPLTATDESNHLQDSTILELQHELPFSRIEYAIFILLGMAMLWSWYDILHKHPLPIR